MAQSQVIIQLIDASVISKSNAADVLSSVAETKAQYPDKEALVVLNKMDLADKALVSKVFSELEPLHMSAKTGEGIEALKTQLLDLVHGGQLRNNDTIITNARHYDALGEALTNIQKVQEGLQTGLSGDLLAIDIREALYHFGRITGEISTDDLLGNIFANFCIGK